MRFQSIRFEKVGPFENTVLEFQSKVGLHLIHGPNEAGKTSALKQMMGFLFGFDAQSGDDFLFHHKFAKVQASVVTMGGEQKDGVVRDRARKVSLAGANEQDLHPANMGKVDFGNLFAIDQMRLRGGSDALFSGKSDLQTILFESMTGLPSAGAIRKAIQERKDRLLKVRSGHISDLIKGIEKAGNEVKRILSELEKKGKEVAEYRSIGMELEQVKAAQVESQRKRSHLMWLSGGVGILEDIREKERELAELGPLPPVGVNFESDWIQANEEKTRLESALATEQAAVTRYSDQLKEVAPSRLNTGQLVSIDTLVGDKKHVKEAMNDLPGCIATQEETNRRILAWVADWFPSRIGEKELTWLPTDREIKRISDAVSRLQSCQSQVDQVVTSLEEARLKLKNLQSKVDGLPGLEDIGNLKRTMEEQAPSVTEVAHNKRGKELEKRRADLIAELNRMVPPVVGEAALERIAAPTNAEIQGIVEDWSNHQKRLGKCTDNIATIRNSIVVLEQKLNEFSEPGRTTVSRSQYDATKELRDRTWDLIRGERKGKSADQNAVWKLVQDAKVGLDLDETMTGLVARADEQADSLLANLDLVNKTERTQNDLDQARHDLHNAEADVLQEKTAGDSLKEEFGRKWGSWKAGPVPLENILGLPQWMEKVDRLHKELRSYQSEAADHRVQAEELTSFSERLSTLLGVKGSLSSLRANAKEKISEREGQEKDRTALLAQRENQDANRDAAEQKVNEAKKALVLAKEEWDGLIVSLGDPIHEKDRGMLAASIKEIQGLDDGRRKMAGRITNMETVIFGFLKSLASVTGSLGMGDGPWSQHTWSGPFSILETLAKEARETEGNRGSLKREWEQANFRLGENQILMDQNQSLLEKLLLATGCGLETEVPVLLEKIRLGKALKTEVDTKKSKLIQDMGVPLADYQNQLGQQKGTELRSQCEELDQASKELGDQVIGLVGNKSTMERVLGELVNSDTASKARMEGEQAKAQLEEAVREWKLNHLARCCLERAIEKQKSNDDQTPLSRAAHFFTKMTRERFESIEFDGTGEKLLLEIKRRGVEEPLSFSKIENTGLSEGTADQLWLALRLAGIEARVNQMIQEGRNPMPIILDDVLVSFDEERTKAALEVLAEIGQKTQVILFSHHHHVSELAKMTLGERADLIELQRA